MNKFSETEIIWQLRNWAIEVESPRNDGCPSGGIGIHNRLKICRPVGLAGSSPALGIF